MVVIFDIALIVAGVLLIIFRKQQARMFQRIHREHQAGGGEYYASRSTPRAIVEFGVICILLGIALILRELGVFVWPWE